MDTFIAQFFENTRNGFFDLLACLFSLIGETLVIVVVICLIFWLYDKRFGEKLALTAFSSMTVNGLLKGVVSRPRPYVDGTVSRVEIDNVLISTTDLADYQSFPSGHSQMGAGVFTCLGFHVRKSWGWVVYAVCTLGVMWSRLYFGVHYFTDVLTGFTLGAAFACGWEFIYRRFESKKYFLLGAFALLSILFLFFSPTKELVELSACTCAAAICMPIEHKFIRFENQRNWKKLLLRGVIGLALVAGIFALFSYLPFAFLEELPWKFVKYFCVVACATLGAPALFKVCKV